MTKPRPKVYIDANVFISAFEHLGAHSDHAWWIFHAIEDGEISGATSEMTLAEILVKPIQASANDLVTAYREMIVSTPGFDVLPVHRAILVGAAELRAHRPALKLPDAIHVATARATSCTYFVSDDRRMNVTDDLKLLPINPFTLDDILRKGTS